MVYDCHRGDLCWQSGACVSLQGGSETRFDPPVNHGIDPVVERGCVAWTSWIGKGVGLAGRLRK